MKIDLANQIRKHRKLIDLSQEGLADALEVSRQAVSAWETGNKSPTLAKIVDMAELFGVTLDELVFGE